MGDVFGVAAAAPAATGAAGGRRAEAEEAEPPGPARRWDDGEGGAGTADLRRARSRSEAVSVRALARSADGMTGERSREVGKGGATERKRIGGCGSIFLPPVQMLNVD